MQKAKITHNHDAEGINEIRELPFPNICSENIPKFL